MGRLEIAELQLKHTVSNSLPKKKKEKVQVFHNEELKILYN